MPQGRLVALLNAPVKRPELLVWCLLATILFVGRISVAGGPALSNDGYQYLSVADNLRAGNGAKTSLVHFDSERSWGTIPAPMTTLPAGYPLVLSLLARAGVRAELAGVLISALATLALLVLYFAADRLLALGGLATRFLFLWTIVNAQVAQVATSVATEALFTAIGLGAMLAFAAAVTARDDGGKQLRYFLVANALVGLSYWVRYAGLFFFAGSAVLVGWLLVRHRDRRWLRAAAGFAVAAVIIALGLVRNQRLVGTWKGGNTLVVHHRVVEVVTKFVASVHHVFIGERAPGWVIVEMIFVLGVLAILLMSALPLWRERRAPLGDDGEVVWVLVLFTTIYSAAMIYAGITSPISFGPRMFYPLLPVFLLVGASLLASVPEARRARVALILSVTSCAYLAINLHHAIERPSPAPHQLVEQELAGAGANGVSLRAWIDGNLGPGEAVVSNRGQSTGYALRRGVVSLVAHEYSNQVWDEAAVKALMARFGVRTLIVYLDDREDIVVTRESPLLAGLVRGERPSWLTLAAQNRDVLVFRSN